MGSVIQGINHKAGREHTMECWIGQNAKIDKKVFVFFGNCTSAFIKMKRFLSSYGEKMYHLNIHLTGIGWKQKFTSGITMQGKFKRSKPNPTEWLISQTQKKNGFHAINVSAAFRAGSIFGNFVDCFVIHVQIYSSRWWSGKTCYEGLMYIFEPQSPQNMYLGWVEIHLSACTATQA